MHHARVRCVCVAAVLAILIRAYPVVVAAPEEKTPHRYLTPELQNCTLQWDSHTVKPVETYSPARAEYAAGELRIVLDRDKVLGLQNGVARWTIKSRDGRRLYWLTAEGRRAYLGGYEMDEKKNALQFDTPPRIRRVDLTSGNWLADLPLGAEASPDPTQHENILKVLVDEKQVFVLSTLSRKEEGDEQLVAYRVTCFDADKDKPRWSRKFRSAGAQEKPHAVLLWSAQPPNAAVSDIQHLAWLGDYILVCAGETQDIRCLERTTGHGLWRFPRIWEHERGFIGPSVWQHILGGAERFEDNDKAAKVEDKPKPEKADKAVVKGGAIIAGPVVVKLPQKRGKPDDYSIFVAVAKMPEGGSFAKYLAECVVYEIEPWGRLLAVAHIPRLVDGSRFCVHRDGVVWACQENALVKVACSKYRSISIGMGGGGPDLIARIPWYRQIDDEPPSAWLRAGKAGDPLAFTVDQAFRVTAGGYVVNDNDRVYHFPITSVDLKTGLDRKFILNVPFKGDVPVPSSNYSQESSPGGKIRLRTYGPHILAVTGLQVDNGRLQVFLGMDEWSAVVEFEIKELMKP